MKKVVLLGMVVALALAMLPVLPSQAAVVPLIERFHATCSHFSVQFTMQGYTDDANGFDRLRYEVLDGAAGCFTARIQSAWSARCRRRARSACLTA